MINTQPVQILFLLMASWSAMQAAANPSNSRDRFTLDALKRSGTIPSDKKAGQQKAVLINLNKLLSLQDKLLPLCMAQLSFDRYYCENLSETIELSKTHPLYINYSKGTDYSDPEAVAFFLRYQFMFKPATSYDAERYAEVKSIVQAWQSSENINIQELVRFAKANWELSSVSNYNEEFLKKPIKKLLAEFIDLKKQLNRSALTEVKKGPLAFVNTVLSVTQDYFQGEIDRIHSDEGNCQVDGKTLNNAFAKLFKIKEIVVLSKTQLELVKSDYAAAKHELMALQQEISRVLAATKDDPYSLIRDLPAVRMHQKPKRPQPTKKKKGMPARPTVQRAQQLAQPCSSSDPAPVLPLPTVTVVPDAVEHIFDSPQMLLDSYHIPEIPRPLYERLEHPDGSYTKREDDIRVIVYDRPNNTKIQLFKVDKPQNTHLNPNYTPWVQKWFDAPDEAFAQQGYHDTTSNRFKYRATARVVHGFTRLVDGYLSKCSTRSTTVNRNRGRVDTLITMPGTMGSKLGLFCFIIDSANGQWYHRNFVERSGKQLLDGYATRGYYDVEFPELK